ncbi:diaminopimelate decarboxylase [Oleiphilus sp. HI0071]|jgi:diaminopimelate decarboxylase|uniref:diaminopimelate decarboxylase n=1 Tax=unclassified Oleiphilus TaxID=2631174 RepID=UPI0007C3D2F9|nr:MULTISPECIES: diaminopimelate decarboxylase [unclassified Oleiphilus]KZY68235.1 diaminopimelate decarboxylase [Oleiphilus sp. HI0065]KZY82239.1 diaminopimelate decarboxylase [Oleiphilus sp. HI0071]KZZ06306.1 diaminopimelate decarboxylase [Oleiphilus sp. HI0073]KZZ42946.1 diaminopimelate decarboxylase [Oleiphilus sp. HI0118]KZZ48572.1 diaminopimelate decarboxylase [Oleiphilus sp. HI0122]KZZ77498.1 diaminopimelate decarboxylase [Oleiphilus sp. HI0133]
MDYFVSKQGQLFAEDAALSDIAEEYGTPTYVYSRATLERHYHAYDRSFGDYPHLICYAIKANSNLAVLSILAKLGSGFDIVSIGELRRVIAAGGDPSKVVFSGVGKQADEMAEALKAGVHCFNVESESELYQLNDVAMAMNMQAPVSLRVNPDVDANTHPYISTGLKDNKFGVSIDSAYEIYKKAAQLEGIRVTGIDCHIGSQLTETKPFLDALERVLLVIDQLAEAGIELEHLDIGGGLGVRYADEQPPAPESYVTEVLKKLEGRNLTIIMEPGRSIAANAGVLLTRVEYLKNNEEKNFAIVDAAMNDLMRPSLYSAWQEIVPVVPRGAGQAKRYDVVGPICETGDFLGKERELNIEEGDLLAIRSAGAYGFAMSSNYNSRNRASELVVDGDRVFVARQRETFEDQIRLERPFEE